MTNLDKQKKQLQKQISAIDRQTKVLRESRAELGRELKKVSMELDGIKVSDHAVVRYMERVQEIDLDPVREQIIEAIQPMVDILGSNGQFPVGDNRQAVLKDKVVVTIK